MNYWHKISNRGQTLIVLLLILVVTLTVGLSVVTRTVTNVRESATTEQSTRAFVAAEAGVESVLRADLSTLTASPSSFSIGNASANITVTQTGGTSSPYQPTKPVTKDDTLQVNLNGTTATGVQIEWSLTDVSAGEHEKTCADQNNPKDAAMEFSVLNVTDPTLLSGYSVTRYAYKPTASPCNFTQITGFSPATDESSGNSGFASTVTLTFDNTKAKLLRIRPLFHDATVRITPVGGTLPTQSYVVKSVGTSGDTERVVQVEKSISGLPSIFDYALFNGSSTIPLTHN